MSKRSLGGMTQANLVDSETKAQHPFLSDCVPRRADSQPQQRYSAQERFDIGASAAPRDATSHLSPARSIKTPPSRRQKVRPDGSTTMNDFYEAHADDGRTQGYGRVNELNQELHSSDIAASSSVSHVALNGQGEHAAKELLAMATPSDLSPLTIPKPLNRKLSITQKDSEGKDSNPIPRLRKMQSTQMVRRKQDGSFSPEFQRAAQQSTKPLWSLRDRLSKFSTRSTSQLVERWNGEVLSGRREPGSHLDYRSTLRHHESEQTTPRAEVPTTDFRGLLKHYSPPRRHMFTSVRRVPSSPVLSEQPPMHKPLEHRPSDMARQHSMHKSRGSLDACGYCEPEGAYGNLTASPEQEVWNRDASSPSTARGRAFSRHTSGNRGSIPEQGYIHGEQRPLRRTKTLDSHESGKLRGTAGGNSDTSPPTTAYATGLSEDSLSGTITGTSPHVVAAQRLVPYRLSDHDCE